MFRHLIVIGCIFSACAKPPTHVKKAQDVASAFAEKSVQEKGLYFLGRGGFYTDKKIDSLYVDFEIQGAMSSEQAFDLLKERVDQFVDFVNQSEEIRPFLTKYPVTPNEISMSIAFVDKKRTPVEGFSQIHLYEGTIYYSAFQQETKRYVPYDQKRLLPGCPGNPL